MAEGILKNLDPTLQVFSAGTIPALRVSSKTIVVMKEIGINLDDAYPKHVDQFIGEPFDYIITVCDHAKETCPIFTGKVKHRLHIGFDDPGWAIGTEEEVLAVHRRVRDDMHRKLIEFYHSHLKTSRPHQ